MLNKPSEHPPPVSIINPKCLKWKNVVPYSHLPRPIIIYDFWTSNRLKVNTQTFTERERERGRNYSSSSFVN